ncbi:transposase [Gottfriedia endophytica]|uniref:transposase n=1 Tax=Gottfriedia endophytica TaxID=2820819 RepID=UPI002AC33E84|nr:transposase [Gottfriedia endophytica]
MSRKKRDWRKGVFYHVVSRGNNREALFLNGEDFSTFLQILQKVFEQNAFKVTAYCLMTNHFHLLIAPQEESLSNIMGLVNKKYATYFNRKYNRTGHVFEKRFYAEVVHGKIAMTEVSRYIHFNPVRARMKESPQLYRWSSFCAYYYNLSSFPFFDSSALLQFFENQPTYYCSWCFEEENKNNLKNADLTNSEKISTVYPHL